MGMVASCQKGFIQGQAVSMEHAVLTREMISHATRHKKNLYMVQIDFSNAFGSVPHDLILGNMASLGLPQVTIDLVQNIYTDN
jgi:RNA-binding protein YlmH